ncbi:MAG: transposase [Candidatus Jorgensenbacteria bacterium]
MRQRFIEGGIYHVYNRGTEKRTIFLDDNDRFRFIHGLFESNDSESVARRWYLPAKFSEVSPRKIKEAMLQERRPRNLLVDILAFCLMPNHFHLMVRQRADNGVSKFMQKLGTGYTMYFNARYERSGVLFQGVFKSVPVSRDAQFLFLPFYIHANPLDLKTVFSGWREGNIRNAKEVLAYLKGYRWSSFPDYVGVRNFPSVTQRELLVGFIGDEQRHLDAYKDWLTDFEEEDWEARKRVTFE